MSGLFAILFLAALVGVFRPYINGAKRWHFGAAAFVAFILVGVTAPPPSTSKGAAGAASKRDEAAPPTQVSIKAPSAEPTEAASEWVYSTEKDEMRGKESRYAQLDASNVLNLDFPYGEQRGQILVRKSAKFGFDVLVGVRSGQIMCNSFS